VPGIVDPRSHLETVRMTGKEMTIQIAAMDISA
jgi:hypothetical protein